MTCDVPKFRKGQDCQKPKYIGSTLVFESSAECVKENEKWYHPDMMIGECVDTIGNSTLHPPGEREVNGNGKRRKGYGLQSGDYSGMSPIDNISTKYPLWTPAD
eukprot:CAMPEP_0203708888 /NCGR_PEP_ID=MMETSP0091-20130426/60356_1 /ASSEMBLY_ACC=CAM_ASM_001089 /TAXON_ID=426623 /ORGANISM="Chaetoceros affinis, Strain CCMP159" /LENGTH=103 /DNA_ID=CAMNT_0050585705 /DNA_START=39 /DNA_END=347 /DNA_ORIENTATION=+